jgi:phage shock protein A
MGIFSRIKGGISSKANAALDKAIDPEKELDMAILELEEGRKKALQELIGYKSTAKLLEADMEKYKAKATEWERRAMVAVRAGDDEAAKVALKEKKNAQTEFVKIERDMHEAASYAIQLNKSRKEFEIKLQVLKLRKGTLATQIASARSASGDAFGNDSSVWDRFKDAEERIDNEAIETEVDSAMRGEEMAGAEFDMKLAAATRNNAGLLATPDGPEDALAMLKTKMATEKAAKQQKAREQGGTLPALPAGGAAAPGIDAAKPDAPRPDADTAEKANKK